MRKSWDHVPAWAAEFPNDNPALHEGVSWVCLAVCGPLKPIARPRSSVRPFGAPSVVARAAAHPTSSVVEFAAAALHAETVSTTDATGVDVQNPAFSGPRAMEVLAEVSPAGLSGGEPSSLLHGAPATEERLPPSVFGSLLEKLDFELTPTEAGLAVSSVAVEPLELLDLDASDLDVDVPSSDGSQLPVSERSPEPFVFDGGVDCGASETPAATEPTEERVEEIAGAALGRRGRSRKVASPMKAAVPPAEVVVGSPAPCAPIVDPICEIVSAAPISAPAGGTPSAVDATPVLETTSGAEFVAETPIEAVVEASSAVEARGAESSAEAPVEATVEPPSVVAALVVDAPLMVAASVVDAPSVVAALVVDAPLVVAASVVDAPSVVAALVVDAAPVADAPSVVAASVVDAPSAVADHVDADTDKAAAFRAFEGALVEVLLGAGLTRAAALLPSVLHEGAGDGSRALALDEEIQRSLVAARIIRETAEGARFSPDFVSTARAWRDVLSGVTQDLSACGQSTLDGWAGELLKAFGVGRDGKVDVRRELRRRGVAAFGMLIAA